MTKSLAPIALHRNVKQPSLNYSLVMGAAYTTIAVCFALAGLSRTVVAVLIVVAALFWAGECRRFAKAAERRDTEDDTLV